MKANQHGVLICRVCNQNKERRSQVYRGARGDYVLGRAIHRQMVEGVGVPPSPREGDHVSGGRSQKTPPVNSVASPLTEGASCTNIFILVLFLNRLVFVVILIVWTGGCVSCKIIKIFVLVKVYCAHVLAHFLVVIEVFTAFAARLHYSIV